MIIDDRCQVESDVVFGHANLSRHFDNLDLDVDLDEAFRERVDFDQAGIDGARELSKFGDEANISLRDRLVGIGADDAAGNCAEEANSGSKSVNYENDQKIIRTCCGGCKDASDVLIELYHPCGAASVSKTRVCAYDGWRSSRFGGCTLTMPLF